MQTPPVPPNAPLASSPDAPAAQWRIGGVILAGGRGSRLGGCDKALLRLGTDPLASRAAARLRPQCQTLAISANGDAARLAHLGIEVLADDLPDHSGPLAGILRALDWAHALGLTHVASVAVDTPFFPTDLVARLGAAAADHGFALAASIDAQGVRRVQPTFGLWPCRLRGLLRQALTQTGQRKAGQWAQEHGAALALFKTHPQDPFFNINTPADLAFARARAAATDQDA